MTEDEEFFAWLDGELPADHATEVEARVRSDPALQSLAERHRTLRTNLRGAFEPVATQAPTQMGDPALVTFPTQVRAANENPRLPAWTSLAATLAIGLAIGTLLPGRGTPAAPVTVQGGTMVAAASLDKALDTQLASADNNGPVRVGLTFRNADGKWCRSFDGSAGTGLACRAGEDWQVWALFPSHATGGNYRMAAGTDPRLAAVIDETMADDAADSASERAARDNGWR